MSEYMLDFNVFSELHQTPPCPIRDKEFSDMDTTSHLENPFKKKSIYRFNYAEKILDEYEEEKINLQEV